MERIIRLTAFVVLIGIEAATMTLCTIWFAIGALVSFFLTLAGVGKYGQLAAFFAVSAVLDGREWTARSADGSVIEAGALAEIMEIQGVKLIVRKIREEK